MGGGASILYTTPITEKKDGETPILRYPAFKNGLTDKIEPNTATLKDVFINSLQRFGNLPALGMTSPI